MGRPTIVSIVISVGRSLQLDGVSLS